MKYNVAKAISIPKKCTVKKSHENKQLKYQIKYKKDEKKTTIKACYFFAKYFLEKF